MATDVLDRDRMLRASAGMDVVICCIGFPYDSRIWERAWPRAMENLLAGCTVSNARFVFADNLYMYGPQSRPLVEDMPLSEYGSKPRIRSRITRIWQQAHAAGRVNAVAVRASDFYGPDVETSVLSEYGVRRIVKRKPALLPYSPDHPHDFTYVADFARALITLADAPDQDYGQAWHVPNAPTRTLRALLQQTGAMIGVAPRIIVTPFWLVRVAGLFSRALYELVEMRFQTDRPYLVDSSKFQKRFWRNPTSFEEGLAATIAFYAEQRPCTEARQKSTS
jgi:nucleoside-diphosphate-sugar epimerase